MVSGSEPRTPGTSYATSSAAGGAGNYCLPSVPAPTME